jgi:hypothetical protein
MLEPSRFLQLGTYQEAKKDGTTILGILGKREDVSKENFHEMILHPLMEVFKKIPDKIIFPSEGQSSALLSIWSERNRVPYESLNADYRQLGRRATVIRDARIIKEANCLLLFEGPRSQYLPKIGLRELKRGKKVFSVKSGTLQVEEWELEKETGCLLD